VGIDQAQKRRESLGNPVYDTIVASPFDRAQLTAHHLSGVPLEQIGVVPVLGWEKDTEFYRLMDEAFRELGYAPFGKYCEHKNGQIFIDRGKEMWSVLYPLLREGEHVLAVGHAVLVNAIGAEASLGNSEATNTFIETAFGECEGFTLVFNGSGSPQVEFHR
jgi:broad specificity phosphatase PhoE